VPVTACNASCSDGHLPFPEPSHPEPERSANPHPPSHVILSEAKNLYYALQPPRSAPTNRYPSPASPYTRTPRQRGSSAHPQNRSPSCAPRRAVRSTIGRPHCGQGGGPPLPPPLSQAGASSAADPRTARLFQYPRTDRIGCYPAAPPHSPWLRLPSGHCRHSEAECDAKRAKATSLNCLPL
jgi:hypothetical protein